MTVDDFSDQHRPLAQELIDVRTEVDTLLGALTPQQLVTRHDAAKWSIGEIVKHLTVTNSEYLPALRTALPRAKRRTTERPYRYGLVGSYFVKTMEPPVKMRIKAPRVFLPPAGEVGDIAADFRSSQNALLDLLHQYDDYDLASTSLPSPVTRLLRFNAAAAFAIIAAHERRHLWQARNTLPPTA